MKNYETQPAINPNGATMVGETDIQFRTECPVDAEMIRCIVHPWLLSIETQCEPMEHDGKRYRGTDTEVKLKLRSGSPSVQQLRYIFDSVPHAHYAADTMELAENYTGEREPRKAWTGEVERPTREALSVVLKSVATRQKVLEAELDRMQKAYRTLRTMHDLGSRWAPRTGEGSGGGWLALVQKAGTDLTRVVVIEAASPADICSPLKKDREVAKRLLVINS